MLSVGMATAQTGQFLDSAVYTPTGTLTLHFTSEYDRFNVLVHNISIRGNGMAVPIDASDFVDSTSTSMTFDLSETAMAVISNTTQPVVRLDVGSFNIDDNPVPRQESILTYRVPIGVVVPDGEAVSIARLSADHFNTQLERYGTDWRIQIIHEEPDNIRLALLELEKAGAMAVIGHPDITEIRQVNIPAVAIACCLGEANGAVLASDPGSFSLVPKQTDKLDALLALMSENRINRVYPVYPDNGEGRDVQRYVAANAQAAVDAGIRYDQETSWDSVASRLAESIHQNIQSNPGARPGVLIVDPQDAQELLLAASLHVPLREVQWFGTGTGGVLPTDNAAVMADLTKYTVPSAGMARSSLSTAIEGMIIGDRPSMEFGAYDAIQLLGYAMFGADVSDSGLYPTRPVTHEEPLTEQVEIWQMLRQHSEVYNGVSGGAWFDLTGGQASPVFDMLTIQNGQWYTTAIYNHPRQQLSDTINLEGAFLQTNSYQPSFRTIQDVAQIGIITSPDYSPTVQAAATLALEHSNIQLDFRPIIDYIIMDGPEPAATKIGNLHSLGASPIVLHVPKSSSLADTAAQMHIIHTRPHHTTSTDVYSMSPSLSAQTEVFSKILEEDGMRGVAVVYRSGSNGEVVASMLADTFDGEVATIQYDTRKDYQDVVLEILQHIQELDRYGASNVAVLVTGHEAAKIIKAALTYNELTEIRWYGDMDAASSDDIIIHGGEIAENFVAISPAFPDAGRAAIILNILEDMEDVESVVQAAAVFESVRLAAAVRAADGSDIRMVAESQDSLLVDEMRFDQTGSLDVDRYDIWSIRDGGWVRDTAFYTNDGQVEKRHIGLIMHLTGNKSIDGIAALEAARLAIQDYNEVLDAWDAEWRLGAHTQDLARGVSTSISALADMGTTVVVGFPDSNTLKQAKNVAPDDMILISCCSDSALLAHSDDNISRMIPPRTSQIEHLLKRVADESISSLVVLYPTNLEGASIASTVSGMIDTSVYNYDADTDISNMMSLVAADIKKLSSEHGDSAVGVLVARHQSMAAIMGEALMHTELASAKWFGISEDGLLPPIMYSTEAQQLLAATTLEVALPTSPSTAEHQITREIQAVTGVAPNREAYAIYDAVMIGAPNLGDGIITTLQQSSGLLGPLHMDANGDLVGAYDIWRFDGTTWSIVVTHDTDAAQP